MLKVTVHEQPNRITLSLEGRLCRPWTAEAEQVWTNLAARSAVKELALDLSGLTFVDGEGEALLASILKWGPRVHARGLLMRHLVRQVRKGILQKKSQAAPCAPRQLRRPGTP